MDLKKMTNAELLTTLHAALAAVKEKRGSENLKQTRQRFLFAVKQEAAKRKW